MDKIILVLFLITFLLFTALGPINLAELTNTQCIMATLSLFIGIVLSFIMVINLWNKEKRIEAISYWVGYIVIGWPVYLNAVHTSPGMYLMYKIYIFLLNSTVSGCLLYLIILICLFILNKTKILLK